MYINIFLATLYIIKCLLAFGAHVHIPYDSQVLYVILDNKETPSIVLLSFVSFPCISL